MTLKIGSRHCIEKKLLTFANAGFSEYAVGIFFLIAIAAEILEIVLTMKTGIIPTSVALYSLQQRRQQYEKACDPPQRRNS